MWIEAITAGAVTIALLLLLLAFLNPPTKPTKKMIMLDPDEWEATDYHLEDASFFLPVGAAMMPITKNIPVVDQWTRKKF